MDNERIPQAVIEEDHRLQTEKSRAGEALARHRWHWITDESNPERVTLSAFARAVGVSKQLISVDVNAYLLVVQRQAETGERIKIGEARRRVMVSAEKEAVTDAIAKARGLKYATVSQERPHEVREVLQIARERRDRKVEKGIDTTVEEEAIDAAKFVASVEHTITRISDEHLAARDFRFIDVHGYLCGALRQLGLASKLAGQLDWPTEERELLEEVASKVKLAIEDVQARIAGARKAYVNWDAVALEAEAAVNAKGV